MADRKGIIFDPDEYIRNNPDKEYFIIKDNELIAIHETIDFPRKRRIASQMPSRARVEIPGSKESRDLEYILNPLEEVFISPEIKEEVIIRTGIPDLLQGNEPNYQGVILYGPPGTGKTVLLRAIEEVYKRANAYSKEISTAELNGPFVGEFAKNVEREIRTALEESERRSKPSFLFFDEGSIVIQNATLGASTSSKHYQEAIDALKRVLGNERNLVMGISTNELPKSLDAALTREGRLTPIEIGYPDQEQIALMWQYFASKYGVMQLEMEQAETLAELSGNKQGAFIEEFCRSYLPRLRLSLLRERGYNSLIDALKAGANISDSELKESISYDRFLRDVQAGLVRFGSKPENTSSKNIGFDI